MRGRCTRTSRPVRERLKSCLIAKTEIKSEINFFFFFFVTKIVTKIVTKKNLLKNYFRIPLNSQPITEGHFKYHNVNFTLWMFRMKNNNWKTVSFFENQTENKSEQPQIKVMKSSYIDPLFKHLNACGKWLRLLSLSLCKFVNMYFSIKIIYVLENSIF